MCFPAFPTSRVRGVRTRETHNDALSLNPTTGLSGCSQDGGSSSTEADNGSYVLPRGDQACGTERTRSERVTGGSEHLTFFADTIFEVSLDGVAYERIN